MIFRSKEMNSKELKKIILEYLETQRLMCFATFGKEPWAANIYYLADKDLNLYFISKPWRKHCEALKINNKVAVGIADSTQPIFEKQKGIQLNGTASELKDLLKMAWVLRGWNKLIAGNKGEKVPGVKEFVALAKSKIYKIKPKKIQFFNPGIWPEEQFKILELKK